MGVNQFTNTGQMVSYAESKGVPAAGLAVPFSGGLLLFGGLSVVLGVYPLVGAGALAAFLLAASLRMHDFWAQEGQAQRDEMVQFLYCRSWEHERSPDERFPACTTRASAGHRRFTDL